MVFVTKKFTYLKVEVSSPLKTSDEKAASFTVTMPDNAKLIRFVSTKYEGYDEEGNLRHWDGAHGGYGGWSGDAGVRIIIKRMDGTVLLDRDVHRTGRLMSVDDDCIAMSGTNGSVSIPVSPGEVLDVEVKLWAGAWTGYAYWECNLIVFDVEVEEAPPPPPPPPPPEKEATSLTIKASEYEVMQGEVIDVGGYLLDSAGRGLGGKTVVLYWKQPGLDWSVYARVDTALNGYWYVSRIALNKVGTYSFQAVFEGDEEYKASESDVIDVAVLQPPPEAEPTKLTISVDKFSAVVGESVVVSGQLTTNGEPIAHAEIELYWLKPGESESKLYGYDVTDLNGEYRFNPYLEFGGIYKFYAYFKGSKEYKSSRSSTVSVIVSKKPVEITIALDKSEYMVGEEITLTGHITVDKIVDLELIVNGEVWATFNNDEKGDFWAKWKHNVAGEYEVYVRFKGTDKFEAAESNHVKYIVYEEKPPEPKDYIAVKVEPKATVWFISKDFPPSVATSKVCDESGVATLSVDDLAALGIRRDFAPVILLSPWLIYAYNEEKAVVEDNVEWSRLGETREFKLTKFREPPELELRIGFKEVIGAELFSQITAEMTRVALEWSGLEVTSIEGKGTRELRIRFRPPAHSPIAWTVVAAFILKALSILAPYIAILIVAWWALNLYKPYIGAGALILLLLLLAPKVKERIKRKEEKRELG